MSSGYFRYPTIYKNSVVFVCEDDLWTVKTEGGAARRLTANNGEVTWPALSPDGKFLAYTGREEGRPEIYLMPAEGGPSRRITFLGNNQCQTVGWTENNQIILAHSGSQPFGNLQFLYSVGIEGNSLEKINVGPARAISFNSNGGLVIGRNNNNPARWKRYRGGTTGQIWIDENGGNEFRPLLDLQGNLDSPIWLGERIYFLSDHEGIANLYSCLPSGDNLLRHTNHNTYYARNASSDGLRIVYHAGGDLYLFDPETNKTNQIPVDFRSSQTQRNRKFVPASRYLGDWALHPKGHSVAITTRGKAFTFGNWEGAVLQHGNDDGDRYRLVNWLKDGQRMIAVSDTDGEEKFVILQDDENSLSTTKIIDGLDIGRPVNIKVNPQKDQILFSNHRHELLFLDLENKKLDVNR